MGHLTETKVAWEMEAEGTFYCVEHAPLVLLSLQVLLNHETSKHGAGEKRWIPMKAKQGFYKFLWAL